MRTGLYFDLRNPGDWGRGPSRTYERALELAASAEAAGVGAFWVSEHHFTADGYLPQPLVFAAALAARTERARIGTAIVAAPLHHPVHLAEQAAVVDLISGGRLELGLGAGYVAEEFERFGAEIGRRYGVTDDAVRVIRALYEERAVTPVPVQDPLPIWLGYAGPRGAVRAGRLGAGLLSLRRDLLPRYREGLERGGHHPATARMGGVVWMLLGEDPERIDAEARPYLRHQRSTYAAMSRPGSGSSPTTAGAEGLAPGFRSNEVVAMTPEQAVEAIRENLAGLPVTDVYFWADYCGMPDRLVAEHADGVARVARALAADEAFPQP
ncbi:MAG: LLM class flavin-dependent oxidoreductase [Solirubrobacterales bacterium]|nr:LLM class flavin-dependent oxidoreductase [Solirubrobacterales bacterium]